LKNNKNCAINCVQNKMIETLFYLIIFFLILLVGYISLKLFLTVRYSLIERWRTARRIQKTFKRIKRAFNLCEIKDKTPHHRLIEGETEGYRLSMKLLRSSFNYRYQIIVTSQSLFSYALVITRKNLNNTKQLVMIEDPTRLTHLHIYGSDKAAITGLLDFNTRELINSINNFCIDFTIEGKEISLLIQAENIEEGDFRNIIKKSIKLASYLKNEINSFGFLLQNTQHDPVPAVRKNNLKLLCKHYKDNKRTQTVLKKALKDESFEVNMFAAETLGLDLFTHLVDTIIKAPVRNKIKAIQILREKKLKKSIGFLLEYYDKTRLFYVKKEIIKTLHAFKFKNINEFLIKQLSSRVSEIKQVAIEILAACGERSTIGPLHGIIQDPAVSEFMKQKAEYAIAEIRSRTGDTGEGWLSVAAPSPEQGALSLKQSTDEGALSLADAEAGKNGSGNE
jgi:hypothetical protein